MINLTIRMEIALQTRKDIRNFFIFNCHQYEYTRFRSLCFVIVSLIEIDTSIIGEPISRFDSIEFLLSLVYVSKSTDCSRFEIDFAKHGIAILGGHVGGITTRIRSI